MIKVPPSERQLVKQALHLYYKNREWLYLIFKKVGLKHDDKVLDIGCGGIWTALAARGYGLEPWAVIFTLRNTLKA